MMDWIESIFALGQQWLFEAWVSPAMFAMGLGNLLEDGFAATGWLLVGLAQLVVLVAVITAVVVSNLVSLDGRSDWLEGVLLLAAYVILAAGFYFQGSPAPVLPIG